MTLDRRGWHRKNKSNAEKSYYDFCWSTNKDRFIIGKSEHDLHITRDEALDLAEWIINSAPQIQFKVTTILGFDPKTCGDKYMVININDENTIIEEIYEN